MTQSTSTNPNPSAVAGHLDLCGIWSPTPAAGASFAASSTSPVERDGLAWSVSAPRHSESGISFGSSAMIPSGAEEEVVLSFSLSVRPDRALQAIQRQSELIDLTQHKVSEVGQWLDNLPEEWLGQVAYTTGPPAILQNYLIALKRENANLEAAAAREGIDSEVSFGGVFGLRWPKIDLRIPQGWQQTVADYQVFTQQSLDMLRPTLRIETNIDEALLARTLVGLTGDFETTWFSQKAPTHREIHRQTLSLSLKSRMALLQLMGQTSAGAATLAAKFTLPGGAVLALPAIWRYLQDVMQQTRTFADRRQQLVRMRHQAQ